MNQKSLNIFIGCCLLTIALFLLLLYKKFNGVIVQLLENEKSRLENQEIKLALEAQKYTELPEPSPRTQIGF